MEKNYRFKDIHSLSDIVNAMIKGIKKEWIPIDMGTFGSSDWETICYGCAATNTLCELMQEPFTVSNICNRVAKFNYDIKWEELRSFENSIDSLRMGSLWGFLAYLTNIPHITGITITKEMDEMLDSYHIKLPILDNHNYKEKLAYYEIFRDWLIEKGY